MSVWWVMSGGGGTCVRFFGGEVIMIVWVFFFFFSSRRRHTRLQGDWSSDVCSSDLEGLVRNLLLGAADAERLGGRLDVLYSPDAFGHPAAWPTLAREFGIRYGVVWRGLGGETRQERDL